jgi:hypothetical protein
VVNPDRLIVYQTKIFYNCRSLSTFQASASISTCALLKCIQSSSVSVWKLACAAYFHERHFAGASLLFATMKQNGFSEGFEMIAKNGA